MHKGKIDKLELGTRGHREGKDRQGRKGAQVRGMVAVPLGNLDSFL